MSRCRWCQVTEFEGRQTGICKECARDYAAFVEKAHGEGVIA